MKTNRVLAVLGIVAVLVVTAMLVGCGGHQMLLFVADGNNNRVLVYDAPFVTGQSAAAVLGQLAVNTAAAPNPPTAASMARPNVMVDTSGTLYVTDGNNCRVLQFIPPFATGMNATLAIGQPAGVGNLISNTCLQGAAATASGLDIPAGMAFDSAGNLWVADIGNSRVLKYPAPLTAGEAATVVLGQTTLTGAGTCNQGNAAPSATTLCEPTVIAFDSAGNLWVVDAGNNRVLMYSPANLVTGGAATAELGQPAATAFTTGTANNGGVSATSLSDPQSLAFDPQGNLWLTDFNNNRVLMYAKVDLMVNGAPATLEFGQPIATAFTSATANNGGIGPSTLSGPVGLAFDRGGSAYVTEGGNNRTLVFVPPFSNGMNATLVIGQPDFTHNTANNGGESAATQSDPLGTAVF
ncbi:MAG: NHL repeat-containing protein [Candidatus Korobacteraceae bacterium]|jgi:sugar lactone lactonase YvrE